MALSADKAARFSRWMLLVVAIGAVFCAGVFAIGVKAPDLAPPQLEPRDFTGSQAAQSSAESVAANTDWTEAAPLLAWMVPESVTANLVNSRPKDGDQAQAQQAQQAAQQSNNTSRRNVPADWRYVGYFGSGGDDSMALVAMGGQQRIVQVGQEIDGYRFTKIQPELIWLRSGGDELKLTAAAPPPVELDLPLPSPKAAEPRRSGRTADYERFQDRREFWKTNEDDEEKEEDPS